MARILLAFLVLSSLAVADDRFWRDEHGQLVPNTQERSAVKGFGGWIVVTSDTDWHREWETSPDTVPHFTEAHTVGRGQHLFILTFFSNPKLTENREANVTCDINVVRPNGTSSVHQVGAPCFLGELKGPATNVYLSATVLDFVAEPKDPGGKWVVSVTLRDNIREVSLPLKTFFVLVDDKT
ncbi:MAG TPA: hypothetical protein VFQ83_04185 [Candidatus Udaeobacter sp.]|jgi:hypothetical protein|nr:hypothetical protein [Candidatus Udaeobacter sp.]